MRARTPASKIIGGSRVSYLLKGPQWWDYIRSVLGDKSAQPNASASTLADAWLDVPERRTQDAVAELLGALDDKIDANRRCASTEDELVEALFATVPLEKARSTKLGHIASVVLGGTPDRKRAEYWENGTVPWINSGKANDFRVVEPSELITPEALRHSAAKLMPASTTVVAITGATLGRVSRLEIESSGNQSLVGVWANEPSVNDWIYLWIRTRVDALTRHATGGAQQHINKGVVDDLEVLVPASDLLLAWHAQARPLLEHTALLLTENLKLTRLRDALLPRLLSGELLLRDAEGLVGEAV